MDFCSFDNGLKRYMNIYLCKNGDLIVFIYGPQNLGKDQGIFVKRAVISHLEGSGLYIRVLD